MSTTSAGLAVKMGYKNIKVMLKGAPGYKKAGNMLVASDEFVKTGNMVLIDLRDRKQVETGHIARAVNIPLAQLAEAEDDFPASKAAPIVLYGSEGEAKKGAKIIAGWGYKGISLVDGGLEGWAKAGHPLVTGKTDDEINWVRILGKNEVGIAEFSKVAAGKDADRVILDVRTNDEAAGGRFKNAIHIPLDELEGRLSELPTNKEILVHCTTGARAEMASQLLQKAKLPAKFLLANVECEDGECEIEE
ncbi:MAG: rhodanese [Proteobacteria bacterium]|nr:rhodanese [Pseudomonadota bacterium]MBU1714488.1 rhodanese [Pseudomonadota bacterium]